jgi:transposase-like protein
MSNQAPNPYAAPQASLQTTPSAALVEGACPRCQSPNVNRPTFTWWGGALGPKLFSHAICKGCGFGFNFKTGKSNTGAITAYVAISTTIAIVILVIYAMR